MFSVTVESIVDPNILRVQCITFPCHNYREGKGLSETPPLAQKEIIQILKQKGLCRDLDYKSTLESYLSCALELLETHRLSNNFQPF